MHGHLWTIRPWVMQKLRPLRPPSSTRWSAVVSDPSVGEVRLLGRLSKPVGASACVVVVHGLGGDAEGHYMIAAAVAAERAGMASLRLNLRGADGSGEDLYHAGLTDDLRAAIASPELAAFESIHVLGYSLGGHIALRHATESVDPRVRAVAAVCPPIDLHLSAEAIDRPERWVYRRHLLSGLKRLYASVAARRRLPLPIRDVERIGLLREWDERVVAPRFGFSSAAHYYTESSVAPRLSRLAVPALLVAAEADPMVPASTLLPALASPPSQLDIRWIAEGGHVGFPGTLRLGFPAPGGLEAQVLQWLSARGVTTA